MKTQLSKFNKLLAWFAIVNGILTSATPLVWFLSTHQMLPTATIVLLVSLGIASGVSGFYGLRAKPWAYWLLCIVFLPQSVEYIAQGYFLSFVGPLSLKVGWGWQSPPSHFNLNILAIAVCLFSAHVANRLGTQVATAQPQRRW